MKLSTVFLALTFLSMQAWSAGYQLRYQGAESMGTSFASQGTYGDSVSNIYYNPGLFLKQSSNQALSLEVMPIIPFKAEFNSEASGTTYDDYASTTVTGALYYGIRLGNDSALTLAVTTPWATNTEYPDAWEGQFAAIKTELQTINVQPVFSKMFGSKWVVSVGPQIQLAQGTLSSRLPPNPALGTAAGQILELDGDHVGVGAVVAATFMPSEHLVFNLTYNSQIKHELEGDLSVAGSNITDEATAELYTPDVINLGVSHTYNEFWTSHLSFSYTTWNLFDEFQIENSPLPLPAVAQNWQDSYFVALGATHTPNESWTFRGGVSYETSAVENEDRTPRTQDSDRIALGAGASYTLSNSLKLDMAYNHILYLGDIELIGNPATGTPAGSYDNSVGLVRVGLNYAF